MRKPLRENRTSNGGDDRSASRRAARTALPFESRRERARVSRAGAAPSSRASNSGPRRKEMKSHRATGRPVTSIALPRASGDDRPGLTRRQSRSRLREEATRKSAGTRGGERSHSLLVSFFLLPAGPRYVATSRRSSPLDRHDCGSIISAGAGGQRRAAIGRRRPPMVGRAVPLVRRTATRVVSLAQPSRRNGWAAGRVGWGVARLAATFTRHFLQRRSDQSLANLVTR